MCNADSFLKMKLHSCCLRPSSLPSETSLDEGLVQDGMGGPLLLALLSSSSWQDCILYIHEALGLMDEFSYGLPLLIVELVDK